MAKKENRVRITLTGSVIGRPPAQRRTVRALGLNRIGSTNEMAVNDAVQGMIAVVSHLVTVEEIE